MDNKVNIEIDFSKNEDIPGNTNKNKELEFLQKIRLWKRTTFILCILCIFLVATSIGFCFFTEIKRAKRRNAILCSYIGTSGTTLSDNEYCIPEPSEWPVSLWLGDPDNGCDQTPDDCKQFGFIYNGTHKRGNTNSRWCLTGTKIRCVPPTNLKSVQTDVNTLKVVSYNIYDLPYFLATTGQRERSCRIPGWFAEHHPDVDAIALQEAFNARCHQLPLKDIFKHYGYSYSTDLLISGKIISGGLAIVSKWPITAAQYTVFKEAESFDQLSAKGANYVRLLKSVDGKSRVYHLTNAHFQSSGANRETIIMKQAAQWVQMIHRLGIPSSEPLLFMGDLNINMDSDEPMMNEILKVLDAELPHLIRNNIKFTSDWNINDVKKVSYKDNLPNPGWLDYIVYSKWHIQPEYAKIEALDPKVDQAMEIACWCTLCMQILIEHYTPGHPKCGSKFVSLFSLSDHQPVLGIFRFS